VRETGLQERAHFGTEQNQQPDMGLFSPAPNGGPRGRAMRRFPRRAQGRNGFAEQMIEVIHQHVDRSLIAAVMLLGALKLKRRWK
jgi:hypothetical protein